MLKTAFEITGLVFVAFIGAMTAELRGISYVDEMMAAKSIREKAYYGALAVVDPIFMYVIARIGISSSFSELLHIGRETSSAEYVLLLIVVAFCTGWIIDFSILSFCRLYKYLTKSRR